MYQSKKPVMIIPNLAIHMNRDVNNGVEINNQTDLMPIADLIPEETKSVDYFLSFIAEETGIEKEDILDFELNTFCMEEPAYVGVKDTLISSPRLDNQTSVSALLSAIINADRKDGKCTKAYPARPGPCPSLYLMPLLRLLRALL